MDTLETLKYTDFEWDPASALRDYGIPNRNSGFRAWQRFMFLITILVCGILAGTLWQLPIHTSSAMAADQSENITQNDEPQGEGLDWIKTVQGEVNLSSAQKTTPSDCRISARFPQKIRRWCDVITKYSDKRGLPPDLVAAVVLQESGGNPTAFSSSGAVGLMQVMPRDGPAASFMCVNGPCFASRPSQDELRDPEFNISYGTRMLAGLVKKHGSLREALKSYGPMDGGYSYADKVLGIYKRYGD